ncbi:restriction endonuclease subunit S [bacterium]|nr:MAG: restriction endonuclease subunit S [bacterium]
MAIRVRLGDVADILTGFSFKSDGFTTAAADPSLLRGDNVGQGVLKWDGAKHWPARDIDESSPYWLAEHDVIVAMDRPWIEAGLKFAAIRQADLPALLVQRVARLKGTSALDVRFLRYVIGGKAFTDYIVGVQTGTAVPHISRSQIEAFEFNLPSLPEQRAIASILGAIDDKIELNRKMSATLDAVAQALFKSWFVDFDPVRAKAERRDTDLPKPIADLFPDSFEGSELGEIPKGWQEGSFGSIISQRSERVGRREAVILSALASGKLARSADHFTKRVYSTKTDKYLVVERWDFAYNPSRINIGSIGMLEEKILGGVSPVYVVARPKPAYRWFLAFSLRRSYTKTWINALACGSVRQSLSYADFASIPCVVPSEAVAQEFDRTWSILQDGIRSRGAESRILAALRDTLLPKLISGELSVADVGAVVERSA